MGPVRCGRAARVTKKRLFFLGFIFFFLVFGEYVRSTELNYQHGKCGKEGREEGLCGQGNTGSAGNGVS